MVAINPSERFASKIAGSSYLLTFILVVSANFAIYDQLYVPGNLEESARNIVAQPLLFRLGIVMDIVYCIGFVSMTAMLYQVFKSVNHNLALLAVCWQLLYAAVWIVITIGVFDLFKELNRFGTLQDLKPLESFAKSFLDSRFDRYYGGLPFYALGATIFSYLMFRSGLVNKALAAFSMVSCIWCFICSVLLFAIPHFSQIINLWLFDVPMALSQILISIWLIVKV